jgi:hypothetical protein
MQVRNTNHHIFTTKQILEKSHECNISFHQLYIEFKEAFDCVGRFPKIETKKKFCTPAILISFTNITFSRIYKKIKFQNTGWGSGRLKTR